MFVWTKKNIFRNQLCYFNNAVVVDPPIISYWRQELIQPNIRTYSLVTTNGTKHFFMSMEELHEWRSIEDPTCPYEDGGGYEYYDFSELTEEQISYLYKCKWSNLFKNHENVYIDY